MQKVVYLFLISFGTLSALLHAQQCLPNSSLVQNWADTTPAGTDGLVHTTYDFIDSSGNLMTPDSNTANAVGTAIGEWNGLKSTTGVEFDPLPAGQSATSAAIQIQQTTDSSGKTGGCASYNSSAGRIYYGATFQQAAQNGHGATIIAHELGHSLGLADGGTNPTPPSIMNNPSNALPGACTSPVVPTSTVQQNDAQKVPTCAKQAQTYLNQIYARLDEARGIGPPYWNVDSQNAGQTCVYEYGTLNFYVDGELDSSEPVLENVSCY